MSNESDNLRGRLDAQHFGPTENGSVLNFYERRPFNKADFTKYVHCTYIHKAKVVSHFFFRTFDLIFVILFFIAKLIFYYKIFKYVFEAQKISNLDKNVKRKKFKRVNITFVYTLFTLGFFKN